VPRVSVVIPCYNAAATLGPTLDSILSQSFTDLEVLVVDDGSDDDPRAVIEARGDSRVHYRRIANSGTPSRPRNLAVGDAIGEVVFFCDADDLMLPGKIERQMTVFDERPHVGMIFTDFQLIDAMNRVLASSFLEDYESLREVTRHGVREGGGYCRERMATALMRVNFVGTSSVAVRRSVFDEAGGFDERLRTAEDIDLWIRIARITDLYVIEDPLHQYRQHDGSLMQERSARHSLACIESLQKRFSYTEDPELHANFHERIRKRHIAAAYSFALSESWRESRRHYRVAFRQDPSLSTLKGCLLSLPGLDRVIGHLRRLRASDSSPP
jgi:glycosyltransferase involved in cell wall biosynthesis